MKEHNPDNPILHEAVNGPPPQPHPTPNKTPKKRDHETMMIGGGGGTPGFQGTSSLAHSFGVPQPRLERDFQMSVQLNPKIGVGPGIWGQRNWLGFVSGHWNGRWGKGIVMVRISPLLPLTTTSPWPSFLLATRSSYMLKMYVLTLFTQPGGQDSQLVAPDLSTHSDATYILQTHDHPPAFISVKSQGWRVGPREILEKLEDPAVADEVDPKSYCFRLFVSMETGDTRYLHLNTGMWVGGGVRRGTEGMCSDFLQCILRVFLDL